MIRITTDDGKLRYEDITEGAAFYLDQIITMPGAENIILSEEPILNGSKRECGTHLTITDEAWEAVQQAVEESAEASAIIDRFN